MDGRRRKRITLAFVALFLISTLLFTGCGNTEKGTVEEKAGTKVISEDTQFSFIVCGDPQNNYEVFRQILASAGNVDFIIIVGDLTGSGTEAEVQTFLSEMQACPVPYYTVPGNHDVDTSTVEVAYEPYFGPAYQSFDYGNTHFVMIDNSTAALGFYPEQQEWVKADLEEASKKDYDHILAFCHVPPNYPYSAKATPEARVGIKANKELVPILSSGGVEELFCGHYHTYRQFERDGMIITITGGAGAHLHTSSSYYHYVLVEINGDEMTQEVIKI